MQTRWEKRLDLGNDLIDTQHRIFMLLCRKLDIAIKANQPLPTINSVIAELKKFAEFHFASEENLMREIGYPELNRHAHIHTELLMEFNGRMAKIRDRLDYPEDLLIFLNQWLLKHMVKDDLKIANLIITSGSHAIGEDLYKQFLLA
jgi:hemerythrin